MPTARGTFDVNMEAEPPYLDQDGISGTLQIDIDAGTHSYVLEYEYRGAPQG